MPACQFCDTQQKKKKKKKKKKKPLLAKELAASVKDA